MINENRTIEWDGVRKAATINESRYKLLTDIFQNARSKNWDRTFRILSMESRHIIDSVQPDERTDYTLLHHAAEQGNTNAIGRLLELRASKSVMDINGRMPYDLVRDLHEHEGMYEMLRPIPIKEEDEIALNKIQYHLHSLIMEIAGELVRNHELRLPQIRVLIEHSDCNMWFPIPGMYGGFNIILNRDNEGVFLIAESWSRVAEGSGMRHKINQHGINMLDEGFV